METVEGYFARAKIYQRKNEVAHATADFTHAAELTPRGAFDVLAQAEATRRVRQLPKRLPCETPIEPGTTARARDRRQPLITCGNDRFGS
jgi:hypothetical protein